MQNRSILLELKYFNISSLLIPQNPFYDNNLYLFITDEPSMDKVSVLISTMFSKWIIHLQCVNFFTSK